MEKVQNSVSFSVCRAPGGRDACSLAPQTRFIFSPLSGRRTFMLPSFKVKTVIMDAAGGARKADCKLARLTL